MIGKIQQKLYITFKYTFEIVYCSGLIYSPPPQLGSLLYLYIILLFSKLYFDPISRERGCSLSIVTAEDAAVAGRLRKIKK